MASFDSEAAQRTDTSVRAAEFAASLLRDASASDKKEFEYVRVLAAIRGHSGAYFTPAGGAAHHEYDTAPSSSAPHAPHTACQDGARRLLNPPPRAQHMRATVPVKSVGQSMLDMQAALEALARPVCSSFQSDPACTPSATSFRG